jgi:ribosomal protein L24E
VGHGRYRKAGVLSRGALVWLFIVGTWSAPAASQPSPPSTFQGLARETSAARHCPNLFLVPLPAGAYVCTHGADPAPPGVDIHRPRPLVASASARPEGLLFPDPPGNGPAAAAGIPGIPCFGDGQSGNRVQAVYAYSAGHADRYAQVAPSIVQWAADTDGVFSASAVETGGVRHVRFVTDTSCNLVIDDVQLSATGADTFENTETELAAQGYDRPDRKYLVWMDATNLCGIAGYYPDDSTGTGNLNNGNSPGLIARIDSGCWGLASQGESVEAHELMHSMGAVMPTAPHATEFGHCVDSSERMCYADGTLLSILSVCPSSHGAYFDCNHDDYYSTAPGPGNYLATHWNAASNSFLSASATFPTISIADASVSEGGSTAEVPMTFQLTLSYPVNVPVTVRFATADGSASAGKDYDPVSGTVTFAPGDVAKAITVMIKGDTGPELNETFFVNLSNSASAGLARAQAIGTIIDTVAKGQRYWLVGSDGGIFAFADASFFGSTGGISLNQPIVGMAASPTAQGYWFVARDGGIFAFGDAKFAGSTGSLKLSQPIVGMTPSRSGQGYWFVASDGGIFAFGDAKFAGSATNTGQPIVAMAADPQTGGYWVAGRDGGVSAFGGAPDVGSVHGLNQPIVGMAATPTGQGYWLVARDGGIFAFGDAKFFGSTGSIKLNQPILGMSASPAGQGYWFVAADGGIFSFGDAHFWGSTGSVKLNQPIVGMTSAK